MKTLDVGFYSNTKVSLTFSALRWLLILVAFLQAADGEARPVDIYKLIWLRAMAFYKEKHLRTSRHRLQEHVIALKQTSVNLCSHRHIIYLTHSSSSSPPFNISVSSLRGELTQTPSARHRRLVRSGLLLHLWTSTAATRGSSQCKCDQVKVLQLSTCR